MFEKNLQLHKWGVIEMSKICEIERYWILSKHIQIFHLRSRVQNDIYLNDNYIYYRYHSADWKRWDCVKWIDIFMRKGKKTNPERGKNSCLRNKAEIYIILKLSCNLCPEWQWWTPSEGIRGVESWKGFITPVSLLHNVH